MDQVLMMDGEWPFDDGNGNSAFGRLFAKFLAKELPDIEFTDINTVDLTVTDEATLNKAFINELAVETELTTKDLSFIGSGGAAIKGTTTLVGGTVTVNTTKALTASAVLLSPRGIANAGHLGVTVVDETSFTINSSSGTDVRQIVWAIIN